MIEPKGVNAYQVKNFLHVFICTNAKWAIPATQDERRWFILNVSDKRRKDFSYFKNICDDMAGGGRAHLLHYLLPLDLSGFEFRDVPETEALLEQKERTRSGIELLIEEWCRGGHCPYSRSDKPHVIVTSGSDAAIPTGFDNFIRSKAPEASSARSDQDQEGANKGLGNIALSRSDCRPVGQSASNCRLLSVLRKTFEDRCNGGKPISWPGGTEWLANNDDGITQPVIQTAADVGEPDEADAALDEGIKNRLNNDMTACCLCRVGRGSVGPPIWT